MMVALPRYVSRHMLLLQRPRCLISVKSMPRRRHSAAQPDRAEWGGNKVLRPGKPPGLLEERAVTLVRRGVAQVAAIWRAGVKVGHLEDGDRIVDREELRAPQFCAVLHPRMFVRRCQ